VDRRFVMSQARRQLFLSSLHFSGYLVSRLCAPMTIIISHFSELWIFSSLSKHVIIGLSHGSSSAPKDSHYHPHDRKYEREEAEKAMRTAKGDGSPTSDESFGLRFGVENGCQERQIPQQYLSYDKKHERKRKTKQDLMEMGTLFLS